MKGDTSPYEPRVSHYQKLSNVLKTLSDTELANLLAQGETLHTGTGGSSLKLEIEGTPVFVKLVPLNELESKSQSTKNVFNIPTFYQYGVGSAGFNAWREVRAHEVSTEWVLSGKCPNFPILYHWRVLERTESIPPLDPEKWTKKVQYWDNQATIGERLKANHFAPAHVVLFLECIPENLNSWLKKQANLDDAIKMVEKELFSTVQFMNDQDMIHFDAHFWNILCDGTHLYFTDFGLANRSSFNHSEEEKTFYQNHLDYNRYYVADQLVYWLISHLFDEDQADNVLTMYASGKKLENLPETVTPYLHSVIIRYAPVAKTMNDFIQALISQSKRTLYPQEQLKELKLT